MHNKKFARDFARMFIEVVVEVIVQRLRNTRAEQTGPITENRDVLMRIHLDNDKSK